MCCMSSGERFCGGNEYWGAAGRVCARPESSSKPTLTSIRVFLSQVLVKQDPEELQPLHFPREVSGDKTPSVTAHPDGPEHNRPLKCVSGEVWLENRTE